GGVALGLTAAPPPVLTSRFGIGRWPLAARSLSATRLHVASDPKRDGLDAFLLREVALDVPFAHVLQLGEGRADVALAPQCLGEPGHGTEVSRVIGENVLVPDGRLRQAPLRPRHLEEVSAPGQSGPLALEPGVERERPLEALVELGVEPLGEGAEDSGPAAVEGDAHGTEVVPGDPLRPRACEPVGESPGLAAEPLPFLWIGEAVTDPEQESRLPEHAVRNIWALGQCRRRQAQSFFGLRRVPALGPEWSESGDLSRSRNGLACDLLGESKAGTEQKDCGNPAHRAKESTPAPDEKTPVTSPQEPRHAPTSVKLGLEPGRGSAAGDFESDCGSVL